MVEAAWFKSYTPADLTLHVRAGISKLGYREQSHGSKNDFSVCTTWGIKDKHAYLLYVYRRRVSYPETKFNTLATGSKA